MFGYNSFFGTTHYGYPIANRTRKTANELFAETEKRKKTKTSGLKKSLFSLSTFLSVLSFVKQIHFPSPTATLPKKLEKKMFSPHISCANRKKENKYFLQFLLGQHTQEGEGKKTPLSHVAQRKKRRITKEEKKKKKTKEA